MDNFNEKFDTNAKSSSELTIAEIDEALARINERLTTISSAPSAATAVVSSAAKSKMILSVAIILVAMFSLVLSSFAYFTATTYSSANKIQAGKMSVEYVDFDTPTASGDFSGTELDPIRFMPGHVEVRKIYASNKGDLPLYVRASAITEITLDEIYAAYSAEVDTSLVIFELNDDVWKLKDGYYYYDSKLLSGETTPELFKHIAFDESMGNIYKNCTVRIKVIFEVVQANNNGDTVFDAIGWLSDREGGTP